MRYVCAATPYRQEHQGASTSRVNQPAVIDIIYALMLSNNLDASIEAIEHTMKVTHRTLTRQSQEKPVTE